MITAQSKPRAYGRKGGTETETQHHQREGYMLFDRDSGRWWNDLLFKWGDLEEASEFAIASDAEDRRATLTNANALKHTRLKPEQLQIVPRDSVEVALKQPRKRARLKAPDPEAAQEPGVETEAEAPAPSERFIIIDPGNGRVWTGPHRNKLVYELPLGKTYDDQKRAKSTLTKIYKNPAHDRALDQLGSGETLQIVTTTLAQQIRQEVQRRRDAGDRTAVTVHDPWTADLQPAREPDEAAPAHPEPSPHLLDAFERYQSLIRQELEAKQRNEQLSEELERIEMRILELDDEIKHARSQLDAAIRGQENEEQPAIEGEPS